MDFDIVLIVMVAVAVLLLTGANWVLYGQMRHWQNRADYWYGKYLHVKGLRDRK